VARSLAGRGFDVLLAPLNFVPHLWRGRAVVVEHNLLALPSGSPYVTRRKAWYRIRALRSSLRRSQRVVAVSDVLRDRILAELSDSDPAKFIVIPLGLPTGWSERAAAVEKQNRVLVVAALATYKRIDLAIEAFALAAESLPGAELAIAGPGREERRRRFEALAAERGISDRVRFLGNIPYERMAELYGTASVVLHLSTIESFPLPVLEAMGAGVPIVATRIDAAAEVGGEAPIWLEPSADAAETAAALVRAMTDDDVRAESVRRGRERAAEFTWERSAGLLAETLREACAPARVADPVVPAARSQAGRL
jgi:glycosyltransferase involved in cell wall biosynthesis